MTFSERVVRAYEACGRNRAETARKLGKAESTVFYHLNKMGVTRRPRTKYNDAEILAVLEQANGNKAAAARELKIPRDIVVAAVKRQGKQKDDDKIGGRLEAPFAPTVSRTKGVKRYIVTSAQNNTRLHAAFWQNLLALADYYGAEILVSRYTYGQGLWYPPEIERYVCKERRTLAPGLIFCGELNILPTAVNPLSGLETYTGPDSCIVPHAKISHVSVPGADQAKMNYTTGTVTLRNYLQHKAGQKAEFHHAYGALLVEVDSDGDWFVRQLNATDTGTFHDLTLVVENGKVKDGQRIAAIAFGDVHVDRLEEEIFDAIWSDGGMLDQLKPRNQVLHDVYDHYRRNHHDKGNPHLEFSKHVAGHTNVRHELGKVGEFLANSYRIWCQTVVVSSNHDEGFAKWLRETDYKTDPQNASLFLEGNLAYYRAVEEGRSIYLPEWGMRLSGDCPERVKFLRRDESYLVHGVELGMHGDKGPNGFKGSPASLKRLGRKAVIGHSHSSAITDGLYVVGVTGKMRMGYNVGPSSWSRTHCIIYDNGKRSLITMRGTKWRA